MGTLEDVDRRVSYEATRLFHRVWLSEGQPLARVDPAGFSPKARGSWSLLHRLGKCCRISPTLTEPGD